MRAVHVLFYKPEKADHWVNHLVTTFSPPYSHCDIQFDNNVASSIYQNETVYMEKKNFSRPNYERLSLTLTDDEYQRVYGFCSDKFKNKVAFDPTGMVLSFVPFVQRKPPDKTFCSRYVCEALQASGRKEFAGINSSHVSPSSLHTRLQLNNKGFLHISENRILKII